MKVKATQSVEVNLSEEEVKKIVRQYIESKTVWRFPFHSRVYGTRVIGEKIVLQGDRFTESEEHEYTDFYRALLKVIEGLEL